MNRLTILQINIIGIVSALVLALILWIGLIKPKQDATASTNSQAASQEGAGGTQDQVTQKKRELDKTKVDAQHEEEAWKVNSVRYMPGLPFSGNDKDVLNVYESPSGPVGYGFKDIPVVWGKWVTAWYDAQRKDGVVRVPGQEFPIPPEPVDPNYISTVNHLTFPSDNQAWPVQVECKSFSAAMNHLRRFNDMERHGMPVINNVRLDGHSPQLQLSYTLALYVIPSGAPPPADQRIGGTSGGGGAAAAGFGGGYGPPGMMGMMPGGPPMGMSGMPGMPPMGGKGMRAAGGAAAGDK